jgi:hypothetical protein
MEVILIAMEKKTPFLRLVKSRRVYLGWVRTGHPGRCKWGQGGKKGHFSALSPWWWRKAHGRTGTKSWKQWAWGKSGILEGPQCVLLSNYNIFPTKYVGRRRDELADELERLTLKNFDLHTKGDTAPHDLAKEVEEVCHLPFRLPPFSTLISLLHNATTSFRKSKKQKRRKSQTQKRFLQQRKSFILYNKKKLYVCCFLFVLFKIAFHRNKKPK